MDEGDDVGCDVYPVVPPAILVGMPVAAYPQSKPRRALSKQEAAVLKCWQDGKGVKLTAKELKLHPSTVRVFRRRIQEKTA